MTIVIKRKRKRTSYKNWKFARLFVVSDFFRLLTQTESNLSLMTMVFVYLSVTIIIV